jgi:hypothetical protein
MKQRVEYLCYKIHSDPFGEIKGLNEVMLLLYKNSETEFVPTKGSVTHLQVCPSAFQNGKPSSVIQKLLWDSDGLVFRFQLSFI